MRFVHYKKKMSRCHPSAAPPYVDPSGDKHYFAPNPYSMQVKSDAQICKGQGPIGKNGANVHLHAMTGYDKVVYVIYPPARSMRLAPPRVMSIDGSWFFHSVPTFQSWSPQQ